MADYLSELKIDQARRDSVRRDGELTEDVRSLRTKVDRLQLVCRALCELISEHTDISNETLLERIRDVDLRDGSLDGKLVRSVINCPQCNRPGKADQTKCLYCGAALTPEDPMDLYL
jgi:hypothetical protein